MKFLGRLLLWQKLTLLIAALLAPSLLLAGFYLNRANQTVRNANLELTGANYTRALDVFRSEIIRHRAVANMFLNGESNRREALLDAESGAQKAAAEIDALDARDAEVGERLELKSDWQAIKSEWNTLMSRAVSLPPDDSALQHDELIVKLLDFGGAVAMRSGMARDPDPVAGTLVSLSTGPMSAAVNRAGIV